MAMSLSQPDPSSSASIAAASFGTARRGFDQNEVRDFLRQVAAEFGRLEERQRFLEREIEVARSQSLDPGNIDEDTLTRLLGEESVRLLSTARSSGAEIRQKAEEAAGLLLSEASGEAARVREEADLDASRRRADAAADAEAELEMAKQQGREMVAEARAYRERVLAELADRRERAREQIEQLVHGRDRLVQAFERARLVAVDVVAELQPLGEPDEYVNLTPTTGPLPVMVANSPRPHEADVGEVVAAAAEVVTAADAVDEDVADADGLDIVHDDDRDADSAALRLVDEAPDGVEESDEHADDAPADDLTADDLDSEDDPAERSEDAAADNFDRGANLSGIVVGELPAEMVRAVDTGSTDVDEAADVSATHLDAVDVESESIAHDDQPDVVVDLFARLRAEATEALTGQPDEADGDAADIDEMSADEAAAPAVVADASEPVDVAEDSADDSSDEIAAPDAFARRDDELDPLIAAAAKKLKRVLADEQNDVLDALRRNEPVAELAELVADTETQSIRYADAIAVEIAEAVAAGGAMSKSNARALRKAVAADAAEAAVAVVDQRLVWPLRDRLERCVLDGDGDNAAITKTVRSVYREFKTQHIDEHVDDVFRTAYGRGAFGGFDVDALVLWGVDGRHPACPDCDDNALSEAITVGSEFPTGHTSAPAHSGCRCILLPAPR